MKTYKKDMFKIVVCQNYEKMSRFAANILISEVIQNPEAVLGLATGSTPEGMYQEVIKSYKNVDIDFSKVKTFNLDEYYGLPKDNEQSYHYFMKEKLFKNINIDPSNTFIPNGEAKDATIECERFEKAIIDAGGVDLQVLGIGNNGHIGFNEPAQVFPSRTTKIKLTQDTIDANSRFFDNKEDVPKESITQGIGTIMKAKKIILLASGKSKAGAIKETIFGDITPKVPASILQLHNNTTVILDEEAASSIMDLL